ncbi:hypothetical protein Lal_00008110 [Lupinus albus]|nr:hypothetical protein Lal_00008110 [Lupinus albus]
MIDLGYGHMIYVIVIKAENQHYDVGKVFKEPNPTSSYDLERKKRGGSSHFVRHGYKTPLEKPGKGTLLKNIAEVDKLGLENRKWYSNIGFGDGDNNRGSNGIGGGRSRSNGGMGSSNGQRDRYSGGGGRSNGGGGGDGDIWGGDYLDDYYDYYVGDNSNDIGGGRSSSNGGDNLYDDYDFFYGETTIY